MKNDVKRQIVTNKYKVNVRFMWEKMILWFSEGGSIVF